LNPADVPRALRGAWSVADEVDGGARAGRLLDLLMDGLRYWVSTQPTDCAAPGRPESEVHRLCRQSAISPPEDRSFG